MIFPQIYVIWILRIRSDNSGATSWDEIRHWNPTHCLISPEALPIPSWDPTALQNTI